MGPRSKTLPTLREHSGLAQEADAAVRKSKS